MVTPHWQVPPEEMVKRAYFIFALETNGIPQEPDGRLMPIIHACDWWRVHGQDINRMLTALEKAEAEEDEAEQQKIRTTFLDIALDNKQIIRNYFGSSTPFYFSR